MLAELYTNGHFDYLKDVTGVSEVVYKKPE